MALPYALSLNWVDYNTIRGSIVEQRGSGLWFALPRRFTVTLDIESKRQEDNLRACMEGIPVRLRDPQGIIYLKVIVIPQDIPAVIITPYRPFQVSITIEELL